MGFAIRALAHYLPETEHAVAELPELRELSDVEAETYRNLGIDRVRGDDGLTTTDLAAHAGRRALAAAGLEAADVDALIVVESRAQETLLSSEATRLQAALGARRALTFSVGGLGCVSLTPALLAARGLLAADPDLSNVLVLHGSKPATARRYRHPVTISGDGGQAVVLGRTGDLRILDIVQRSNGEYWDLFTVPYRDRPVADWRETCTDLPTYALRLAVETRNRLRDLHSELLARNGMTAADVACHISHNLSAASSQFVEQSLGVRLAGSCRRNLRRHGHLGPNDVLLNLSAAIDAGELGGGQRAVLVNASPVAAWSLLLVENGPGHPTEHYL